MKDLSTTKTRIIGMFSVLWIGGLIYASTTGTSEVSIEKPIKPSLHIEEKMGVAEDVDLAIEVEVINQKLKYILADGMPEVENKGSVLHHEVLTDNFFMIDIAEGLPNAIQLPFSDYEIFFSDREVEFGEFGSTVLFSPRSSLGVLTALVINKVDTSQIISLAMIQKKIPPHVHRIKYK